MRKIEKNLRERLKQAILERDQYKKDRDQFRLWFSNDFRDAIKLLSQNQTWCMAHIIEKFAKRLTQVENWWW